MLFIGYDIGSSSIKASVLNGETGEEVAHAAYPENEMPIISKEKGWAEQDPDTWWKAVKTATNILISQKKFNPGSIKGIGITYQMHGLVIIDKDKKVLRPSIIWCDSRAVDIGKEAFSKMGEEKCLSHILNSPGNFTASKLKWVNINEPHIFDKIYKAMLPGDYIGMKFSGEICTTVSGLSEGMFWDFKNSKLAGFILDNYGISSDLLPDIADTFSIQGVLTKKAAGELGLKAGIPISYRVGDQPNNAFSLNVLNPGEIASTAGTSGVVYGISDSIMYDKLSRVNTFAHVNHTEESNRLGILLCINGTGISNSWLKKILGKDISDYNAMNMLASQVKIGSDGLCFLPFGNGAERMFQDKNIGAQICNLNFNKHTAAHLARSVQEGVAFAFKYGIDIMKSLNLSPSVIKAGYTNMFLSPIFRQTLSNINNVTIELYNTDGAQGAARGAAVGTGYFSSPNDACIGLHCIEKTLPIKVDETEYNDSYNRWLNELYKFLNGR